MERTYHIEAAVACPVERAFTYKSSQPVSPGCRIRVPFGSKNTAALVLSCQEAASDGQETSPKKFRIKPVSEVIDENPVLSQELLSLGRWLSQYYMHPVGEVFRAMTPAAVHFEKKGTLSLTKKGQQVLQDTGLGDHPLLAHLFSKKKALSRAWVQKKCRDYHAKTSDSGESQGPEDLLRKGLIYEEVLKNPVFRAQEARTSEFPRNRTALSVREDLFRKLNSGQEQVFLSLVEGTGVPRKPWLLRGVTGSGKTEVYLHLIRHILLNRNGLTAQEHPPQILVMVPEISLTPQTTSVFEARFPGGIAVVHSGLSDSKRWQQLEKIRSGEASVLIGPRSAVFAPFRCLRLVIVDEEHDSSYKQQQGFRYHGRDVAVVRAGMEQATVLLGSATPSMESLANARQNRYHLLELEHRAAGQPMPEFLLAETAPGHRRKARQVDWDFAPANPERELPEEVRALLQSCLDQGQQAIVLVNRRGYAGYVFDPKSGEALTCPDCSISMTLHKSRRCLICHYCSRQMSLEKLRKEHPERNFLAIGQGSQKTEEVLQEAFPAARIARLDSDVTEKKDRLEEILGQFRTGKLDILTGTQMLAKGHDFPNVTLTVLLEADQMLNLPDFRAGERVFQLLVQAAGRSGRGDLKGQVVLQTSQAEHEVIRAAVSHDFHAFAEKELAFRREHLYPPFSRMIMFELNSPSPGDLVRYCDEAAGVCHRLAQEQPALFKGVRVLGPTLPAMEKINGRFRRIILFSSPNLRILRQLCQIFRSLLPRPPGGLRLNIDVDPQSLI